MTASSRPDRGDVVEAEVINEVFGPAARGVRVSSTKSLHGHLLGGSGALEFAAALLALEGVLPPTGFLEEPDPACGLLHVARQARACRAAPRRDVEFLCVRRLERGPRR